MDEYYYVIVNDVQDMERLWQLQKDIYQENSSSISRQVRLDIDGDSEQKKECFENIKTALGPEQAKVHWNPVFNDHRIDHLLQTDIRRLR